MHKTYAESKGRFTLHKIVESFCFRCGRDTKHTEEVWESNDGGYEDYKFTCCLCKHVRWAEGIDSYGMAILEEGYARDDPK